MKTKLLCTLAAEALALTVAAETPSMVWGWCEDVQRMGPLPEGWYCESIIGFTDELATQYAGNKVTSILVTKGYYAEENPVIDIFIADAQHMVIEGYDELQMNEYLIKAENVEFTGNEGEWVEFQLPEPFEIEAGKGFYAGWGYLCVNENSLPLTSDMVTNTNLNTSWMGGGLPGVYDIEYWNNCRSAGANCIRLRIAGDNLPGENLVITGYDACKYLPTGEKTDISINFTNKASKTIESVELELGFNGGETINRRIEGISVAPGEKGVLVIKDVTTDLKGNLSLTVKATKINGKEDTDPSDNTVTIPILSLSEGEGFQKQVVAEEGTGTWCGNCPRGIVGMHRMAEKYPDSFIGIAMHGYDDLEIEAYQPILDKFIESYPMVTLNRMETLDPGFSYLEEAYGEIAAIPAITDITFSTVTKLDNAIYVEPAAVFAVNEESSDYGWAFVVTENQVGPVIQSNYYTNGSLEGWNETNSYVMMKLDEVARQAVDIMGAEGSIPSAVKAGEPYSCPITIEISNVTDINNADVIAMVINRKTGFIENAARFALSDETGVVAAGNPESVVVGKGRISLINGTDAMIYKIDGTPAGAIRNGETLRVENGLYIVKTPRKAVKVSVR